MKPKILITTSTFPRWADDTQPRFVLDFAQAISKYFTVFVLAPFCNGAKKMELIDDVTVYRYRYFVGDLQNLAYGNGMADNLKKRKSLYITLPFYMVCQFVSALKIIIKYKIQIVNTHWIIPQGFIGWLLKLIMGKRIFLILHSHGGDLYRYTGLNWLKKRIIDKSDLCCLVSTAMREYACKNLQLNNVASLVVSSMGVDFHNVFIDKNPIENREGLVFVGRLTPKKGLEIVLKSISILYKKGIDIKLSIVGGGEAEEYVAICEGLGISEQVNFLGKANHQEICDVLNCHKYFIFSSIKAESGDEEGLGLTPIEAMGSGCLVIASDIPQVKDYIVHNITGVLFQSGDAESLANTIAQLECTAVMVKRIAENGKKFVLGKYDWDTISGSFYKEVITRSQLR